MRVVRTLISLMTLVTHDTRDHPARKKIKFFLTNIRRPQCKCCTFAVFKIYFLTTRYKFPN